MRVAFVLFAVMALSALVSSPQAAAPPVISIQAPQELQAAALSLWTRARISAAPAMTLLVDRSAGGVNVDALHNGYAIGPTRMKAAGMAAPDAEQIARAAYPQDWAEEDFAPREPIDVPTGTAGVYTFYDVNTNPALWQIYPHIWDGKLTFNTPGGPASCSATVTNGNNIVTAAHCLYDTTANVWYSDWVFTPAFRNESAPYGTFPWAGCSVLPAWVNLSGAFNINTWTRHDVAVCTMGNNTAGQTLNEAVGWAGRLWDADYRQLNFNSGYPANTYTDDLITDGPAQYLRACTHESFQQTTDTLGGGCFWGRGISGGSWFVGYKPFVPSGWINSVNSGLFLNRQNIYGARFTSNNIGLLCAARGC